MNRQQCVELKTKWPIDEFKRANLTTERKTHTIVLWMYEATLRIAENSFKNQLNACVYLMTNGIFVWYLTNLEFSIKKLGFFCWCCYSERKCFNTICQQYNWYLLLNKYIRMIDFINCSEFENLFTHFEVIRLKSRENK